MQLDVADIGFSYRGGTPASSNDHLGALLPPSPSPINQLRNDFLVHLRNNGILYGSSDQPVVDRAGRRAQWMFYSWNLSLTKHGLSMAAHLLLDRLKSFRSTQLATYGTTAIPLLSACVLLGAGHYTGLCVRAEPKGSPEGRQIEGPLDRSRPVVLIDDSLSSGTSVLKGIHVLERAGLEIEGVVALVHFPYRGGRERAESLGYRVETLFDIWSDMGMSLPEYVPGYLRAGNFPVRGRAREGLHPATLAREVAEQFAARGSIPRPPKTLGMDFEGRGGAWVSFRNRRTNIRLARDGFWHFDPSDFEPGRDIVLATAKTVQRYGLTSEQLAGLKIAVTGFSTLESITPAGLDFSQYGIVVRSKAWPTKVGGALPNTQVFISEREQLDLALGNGQMGPFEPYELYRHAVHKYPEEGEAWLPYGRAACAADVWTSSPSIGAALTARAKAVARSVICNQPILGRPLRPELIPTRFSAIGVTLYLGGVVGCSISTRANLDDAIVAAATAAAKDRRFTVLSADSVDKIVPAVSVLFDPEWIGFCKSAKAARKLRLGRDSLAVSRGRSGAMFLESVAPHYGWDKSEVVRQLLRKAHLSDEPAHWTTFRTATWLHSRRTPQAFGFASLAKRSPSPGDLHDDLMLLGRFVTSNLLDDGLPRYALAPVTGKLVNNGSAARKIFTMGTLLTLARHLGRRDWEQLARNAILICLDAVDERGCLMLGDDSSGPMAESMLLAAAAGLKHRRQKVVQSLTDRLVGFLHCDGSIDPHGQNIRGLRDNDYFPNVTALALIKSRSKAFLSRAEAYHTFQKRRFRNLHGWGQAGWLPQCCALLYAISHDRRYADTTFEVADWCIANQVTATGAYLSNLSPGAPTFHTAFIAEGIADAWALAKRCNDRSRAHRYRQSWLNALRFVRQLLIRPADEPLVRNPDRMIGGVRASLTDSSMRIDFAGHMMAAILKGL